MHYLHYHHAFPIHPCAPTYTHFNILAPPLYIGALASCHACTPLRFALIPHVSSPFFCTAPHIHNTGFPKLHPQTHARIITHTHRTDIAFIMHHAPHTHTHSLYLSYGEFLACELKVMNDVKC